MLSPLLAVQPGERSRHRKSRREWLAFGCQGEEHLRGDLPHPRRGQCLVSARPSISPGSVDVSALQTASATHRRDEPEKSSSSHDRRPSDQPICPSAAWPTMVAMLQAWTAVGYL